MDLIGLVFSVLVMVMAGFSALEAVTGRDRFIYSFFERLALSVGLGLGLVTFELLLFSIAGIPFDLPLLIMPWLPVFMFMLLMAIFRIAKTYPVSVYPRFGGEGRRFFAFLIMVLVIQSASVFLRAMSSPLESYDAVINFGIRAKIFFLENGVPLDIEKLEGIGKGHLEYPLLVPLAETWIYEFLGKFNDLAAKIIFPLCYTAFLVSFYYSLKSLFSKRYAMLFTFMLGTLSQVVNFATNGYADLVFAFFVTMAFLFLLRYFIEGRESYIVLSALFTGISVNTKNEAASFLFASAVLIFFYVLSGKGKKRRLRNILFYYIFPLALFVGPWLYYKWIMGFRSADIDPAALTSARLLENAGQIPFMLDKLQQEIFGPKKWNILWMLVLFLTVLRFKRLKGPNTGRIFGFIMLNALVYFCSYLVYTGDDPVMHINTTLSRFLIHFAGISLVYLCFLMHEDFKNIYPGWFLPDERIRKDGADGRKVRFP